MISTKNIEHKITLSPEVAKPHVVDLYLTRVSLCACQGNIILFLECVEPTTPLPPYDPGEKMSITPMESLLL